MLFSHGGLSRLIHVRSIIMGNMEMLEIENIIRKIKNAFYKFISRLRITEETIPELKDRFTEITET